MISERGLDVVEVSATGAVYHSRSPWFSASNACGVVLDLNSTSMTRAAAESLGYRPCRSCERNIARHARWMEHHEQRPGDPASLPEE